ncbi:hypothetical protein N806_08955 [Rhodococcus sp. P27]|nr:hypothetical protein N806_08955 [Rhodococcus sp. P27]
MLVEDAGSQVDQSLLLVTLSDDEERIGLFIALIA